MNKISDPIIKVRGLSKSYLISHRERINTHPTIKDDLVRILRAPLRLIGAAGGLVKEKFWALKNVDLDIYPGEVVALMGVNGSGKSTLLKILSRITQPEKGEVWLKGRTTSLLEVGTGFHEELTGRENIYFNSSILGMSRAEINDSFDEIVAFSEVSDFLDTPVKHYSSGMRVRLAFSIAAHLKPAILLIDEVLAVGDVRFKQKSIKRMKEIAQSGTTIVFVSHVVGHIRQICTRGVVLDKGKVIFDGDLEEGVETYLRLNRADEATYRAAQDEESVDQNVETGIINAVITKVDIKKTPKSAPFLEFDLKIVNQNLGDHRNLWVGIVIKDIFGKSVAPINSLFSNTHINLTHKNKSVTYRVIIENANLAPGRYNLALTVRDSSLNEILHRKNEAAAFEIPNYSLGHIDISGIKGDTFHVLLDYEYKLLSSEKSN